MLILFVLCLSISPSLSLYLSLFLSLSLSLFLSFFISFFISSFPLSVCLSFIKSSSDACAAQSSLSSPSSWSSGCPFYFVFRLEPVKPRLRDPFAVLFCKMFFLQVRVLFSLFCFVFCQVFWLKSV